jgi:hypothetical protein
MSNSSPLRRMARRFLSDAQREQIWYRRRQIERPMLFELPHEVLCKHRPVTVWHVSGTPLASGSKNIAVSCINTRARYWIDQSRPSV